MNILRIPSRLFAAMEQDLRRPHAFAAERVGFLYARAASTAATDTILCAIDYTPIPDAQYIDDPSVGARIDAEAIRIAFQHVLSKKLSAFHVHEHPWPGHPNFSTIDRREMAKVMPSFHHLCLGMPHGAIVLSPESARAVMWRPGPKSPEPVDAITIIGSPIRKYLYE